MFFSLLDEKLLSLKMLNTSFNLEKSCSFIPSEMDWQRAPVLQVLRKTVASSCAEVCFEKISVTSSPSQHIAVVPIQLGRARITKDRLEVYFS